MAGVRVGEDAILGTMGVATREVGDHAIFGGVPAKQLKTKAEATLFADRRDVKAEPGSGKPECG
jgi:acetyltransferase-like isoleucine patch superfamily enzyme